MHAYASDDPVFVAMNNRGQRDTAGLLGTFCVQCHAPMAVALGLTTGANFDPTSLPATARGITCYFCHDVDSVRSTHDNGLELAFDDTMRGGVVDPTDSPAHHSAYDGELMASATNGSTLCGSCHDVVTQRGVALERSFQEWQTTVFAASGGSTCTTCHMSTADVVPPTTLIADGPGLDVRSRPNSFHEHMWPAIDQAYAPFGGSDAAAAQAADIHRDLDPALAIEGSGICVTSDGRITVRIATLTVGHAWPSGAAHDRRSWLELVAYDASSSVVFSSGVVPDAMDPEDLGDPDLVGFWDRTFKDDGTPAHFFWEVATVQSQLLAPPVAPDPATTATFAVGTATASSIDHITVRMRIRPFAHAALDDLVSSNDLDPSIAASLGTIDIAGTDRTWTRANIDPTSDGCGVQ